MGALKMNIKWKISQLPRKYEENAGEIPVTALGTRRSPKQC